MSDIIKKHTPGELEALRNSLLQKWRIAKKETDNFNAMYKQVSKHTYSFLHLDDGARSQIEEKQIIKEIDGKCWSYFFDTMNLSQVMSVKQIEKFHEKLKDPEEYTAHKAHEYMANIMNIVENSFKELLSEVFIRLTNSKYQTGRQIKKRNNSKIDVNSHVSEYVYMGYGHWDINYSHPAIFSDLEKCCCILDNKRSPKYPEDINSRIRQLGEVERDIETDYFDLTLYKTGNQKLRFTRVDILDMINKYGPSGCTLGENVRIKVFNTGW